jgi:hypothetical protein
MQDRLQRLIDELQRLIDEKGKPTVPMAMLRLISIDPIHHNIRKCDAGLTLIANSFGYEVTE